MVRAHTGSEKGSFNRWGCSFTGRNSEAEQYERSMILVGKIQNRQHNLSFRHQIHHKTFYWMVLSSLWARFLYILSRVMPIHHALIGSEKDVGSRFWRARPARPSCGPSRYRKKIKSLQMPWSELGPENKLHINNTKWILLTIKSTFIGYRVKLSKQLHNIVLSHDWSCQ